MERQSHLGTVYQSDGYACVSAFADVDDGFESKDEGLLCPISLDVMRDPVVACDGKTYERSSITLWLDECRANGRELTSPWTGEVLSSSELRSNEALRAIIETLARKSQGQSHIHSQSLREMCTGISSNASEDSVKMLNSEIFEELDAFVGMNLIATLNLSPPLLIVLGNESCGKSTVLERLIGFPIFPRHRNLCTRCPVRVHLRRNANQKLTKVRVQDRSGNITVTSQDQVGRPVALEKLGEVIRQMMDDLVATSGNAIIDDKEIVVEIQVPYCPNLDILDLPGLVTTNKTGIHQNLHLATTELAKQVIEREKEHSIFLLIVDIRSAVNVSLGAKLVQDCGIEERTVGVFTKLDLFVSDDDEDDVAVGEMLQANEDNSLPLRLGWLVCSSKSSSDMKQMTGVDRLVEMERLEQLHIDQKYSSLKRTGEVGMVAVRIKVQQVFEAFICARWVPGMKQYLTSLLQTLHIRNSGLGQPVPDNYAYNELIRKLHQLSDKLSIKYLQIGTSSCDEITILFKQHALQLLSNNWTGFRDSSVWQKLDDFNREDGDSVASVSNSGERCKIQVSCEQGTGHVIAVREKILSMLFDLRDELHQYGLELSRKFRSEFESKASIGSTTKVYGTGRFYALAENLERYLDKNISNTSETFLSESHEWLEGLRSKNAGELVSRTYDTKERCCQLKWTAQAKQLPHDLVSRWFDTVINSVRQFIEEWPISSELLVEVCQDERLNIFHDMLSIGALMQALLRLQDNVERSRINNIASSTMFYEELQLGDNVDAEWRSRGGPYLEGRVSHVRGDGTFDIIYTVDGDKDERVTRDRIILKARSIDQQILVENDW